MTTNLIALIEKSYRPLVNCYWTRGGGAGQTVIAAGVAHREEAATAGSVGSGSRQVTVDHQADPPERLRDELRRAPGARYVAAPSGHALPLHRPRLLERRSEAAGGGVFRRALPRRRARNLRIRPRRQRGR